jgi:hypothetical protein
VQEDPPLRVEYFLSGELAGVRPVHRGQNLGGEFGKPGRAAVVPVEDPGGEGASASMMRFSCGAKWWVSLIWWLKARWTPLA